MDAFTVFRERRDRSGTFERQPSSFREWVVPDDNARFAAAPGRYHLYASSACPWSHRVLIARRLKGLEHVIGVSCVHPFRDSRGWAFDGARYADALNGFDFLSEAYARTDPDFSDRVSVPVLWDKQEELIVNNESADIMRMLNDAFDAWAHSDVDLRPAPLCGEIDDLNAWIYTDINNAVYRAGFAATPSAYEDAFDRLFAGLARAEDLLSNRRYLTGDTITEADWRLWVTLLRFDRVYHTHFRCNGARIVDFPNLWDYTRGLHQQPGIAETISWPDILEHYYTTHDELNPKRIIAKGPIDLDFDAPSTRGPGA